MTGVRDGDAMPEQSIAATGARRLRDLEEVRRLQYDYCFHGDRFSLTDTNRRDKMAALFGSVRVWDLVDGNVATGASPKSAYEE